MPSTITPEQEIEEEEEFQYENLPVYRFETAKNGTAKCANRRGGCQKISKGELRFGNLVGTGHDAGFRWKHFGCMTPYQVRQLQRIIGDNELEDYLSLPKLQGWYTLNRKFKKLIRQTLTDGHMPDVLWRGNPPWNRYMPDVTEEKSGWGHDYVWGSTTEEISKK